jgi:hypothetical protein
MTDTTCSVSAGCRVAHATRVDINASGRLEESGYADREPDPGWRARSR